MQDRVLGYWYIPKNCQLVVATHCKNIRQLGLLIPNGVGKEMNWNDQSDFWILDSSELLVNEHEYHQHSMQIQPTLRWMSLNMFGHNLTTWKMCFHVNSTVGELFVWNKISHHSKQRVEREQTSNPHRRHLWAPSARFLPGQQVSALSVGLYS